MRYNSRRKSSIKRFLSSPICMAALFILAVILIRAAWNVSVKARAGANQLKEAEANLTALQSSQALLSKQVDSLSTDQGVEAALRTRYRAVKEGESVAVIIDTASTSSDQTATAVSSAARVSWWQKLLQTIGL